MSGSASGTNAASSAGKTGLWIALGACASAATIACAALAYTYYTKTGPPSGPSPSSHGKKNGKASPLTTARSLRNSCIPELRSANLSAAEESDAYCSKNSLKALDSHEGIHHGGSHSSHASSPAVIQTLQDLPALLRMRSAGLMGELEVGACLGRGSFGRVYKGRWKGALVAIKVCQHKREVGSKLDSLRESVLSSAIQHPNIVPAYQMCTVSVDNTPESPAPRGDGDETHDGLRISKDLNRHFAPAATLAEEGGDMSDVMETVLISEYCDKGTLERALRKGKILHDAQGMPRMEAIYRCLLDIAAGMLHLHSLGVLHGDLKGANILLKSSAADSRGFKCKITDFGLSRVLEANSAHVSLAENAHGTVSYMPKELLSEGKMTKQVDIYSFGMIMHELYTGQLVFKGLSATQVMFKVMMGYRPPCPEAMPPAYRQLMTACWDEDPASRPPFSDIVTWLRRLKNDDSGLALNSGRNSLDIHNDWETDTQESRIRSRGSWSKAGAELPN